MLDAAHSHGIQPVVLPDSADHFGCYCNSPRSGWIVAQTHSQAERWANDNLTRRGYRTFLPLVLRSRRDRAIPTLVHRVLAPLFTGYLFCHHDSRNSWRPIYETPGVRSVIRCGSEIQWAPETAIDALRATEAARRTLTPPEALWRPGTACTLADGAFYGLPAVILAIHGDTATIGLMMLGHLRQISVPIDSLAPRES